MGDFDTLPATLWLNNFQSCLYRYTYIQSWLFPVSGGPPGSTPANPNGPTDAGIPESLQGLNENQLMLGKVAPFWVPDADAPNCMICDAKFNLVKRRHHCRGCGQVLCSICCSDKFTLSYMDNKEGRVCKPCKNILERLAKAEEQQLTGGTGNDNSTGNGECFIRCFHKI